VPPAPLVIFISHGLTLLQTGVLTFPLPFVLLLPVFMLSPPCPFFRSFGQETNPQSFNFPFCTDLFRSLPALAVFFIFRLTLLCPLFLGPSPIFSAYRVRRPFSSVPPFFCVLIFCVPPKPFFASSHLPFPQPLFGFFLRCLFCGFQVTCFVLQPPV